METYLRIDLVEIIEYRDMSLINALDIFMKSCRF